MPQIDIAVFHSVLLTTIVIYFSVYTIFNWNIITKLNFSIKKVIRSVIYTTLK